MVKLSFSGHEKFHCRQFWLKKGYDLSEILKMSYAAALMDKITAK